MLRKALTFFIPPIALLVAAFFANVSHSETFPPGTERAPQVATVNSPSQTPTSKLEGCVSCHVQIEPMHKYGTTETLDKLKDGKDAVGLTCTACHGGNPAAAKTSNDPKEVARVKEQAHVQPKYPAQWRRNGRYTAANPERSNTLLARESWEFVRFVNPGDLRVVSKTCACAAWHAVQ